MRFQIKSFSTVTHIQHFARLFFSKLAALLQKIWFSIKKLFPVFFSPFLIPVHRVVKDWFAAELRLESNERMCIGRLLDVVDVVRGCFKVKLMLCDSNSMKVCKLTQVHPSKNHEQVQTTQRLGSNLLRHICCRIKMKACRVMIIIWCHNPF